MLPMRKRPSSLTNGIRAIGHSVPLGAYACSPDVHPSSSPVHYLKTEHEYIHTACTHRCIYVRMPRFNLGSRMSHDPPPTSITRSYSWPYVLDRCFRFCFLSTNSFGRRCFCVCLSCTQLATCASVFAYGAFPWPQVLLVLFKVCSLCIRCVSFY